MPGDDFVAWALKHPREALFEYDRINAEARLIDFVRLTWRVLEPSRPFVDGWAVRAICDHLEAVTAGDVRKLLINVPPGCSKSLLTNVFWPAWVWGPKNLPSTRFIGASYAERLSVRDNRKCRILVTSPLYQTMWGDRFVLTGDQNEKVKFENDKTGWKLATSVGGVGTGERGDVFVIDDPHNVKDAESDAHREATLQWWSEVVPTRTNDPEKSAFVTIMQRVHERDVSGLTLKMGGYDHLMLPMEFEVARRCGTSIGFEDPRTQEGELLWPERFPRRHLEEDLKPSLRAWGGDYAVAAQLQQRPSPRGGGMFKRDWFKFVDEVPEGLASWVRGWDLAATEGGGAYTVGVKMCRVGGKAYVVDVRRLQGSAGQVRSAVFACAQQDGRSVRISVPQDPGQSGKSQAESYVLQLRAEGYDAVSTLESGSKEDRARPFAAKCEMGDVYLRRAAWNDAFVEECSKFPTGEFKDQVDACSRAYSDLIERGNDGGCGFPEMGSGGDGGGSLPPHLGGGYF